MKKTLIAALLISSSLLGAGVPPARAADEQLQIQMLKQLFRLPQPDWLTVLNENRGLLDASFFERCDARIRWAIDNNQIDDALRMSTVADLAMKATGQKGRYRLIMVYALLKNGNDALARDILVNIKLTDPDDLEAQFLLAELNFRGGSVVEAMDQFKSLYDKGYHQVDCLLAMAKIDMIIDKGPEAEKLLKTAQGMDANNAEVNLLLEKIARTQEHFVPDGNNNFKGLPIQGAQPKLTDEQRQTANRAFEEGEAYFKAGDSLKAQAAYGRALASNPGHVKSLIYLGALLYQQGDLNGAIDRLSIAVREAPKDREAWRYLGYSFERRFDSKHNRADLDQAILCFQSGAKNFPTDRQFSSDVQRVTSKRSGQANL